MSMHDKWNHEVFQSRMTQ